ncbi:hypothetical protein [Nesterenkonia alba]|uniref:hypothetical protein n=1 Tax=Nesterenkonia alba TaxID=515814 RepID=UPI0003B4DF7B|nr:hypothetical protein [Nesterenkonia alba]
MNDAQPTWKDDDYWDYQSTRFKKNTITGKLGEGTFGFGAISSAYLAHEENLPEDHAYWTLDRDEVAEYRRDFAQDFLNDILSRMDEASKGESITVLKGHYTVASSTEPFTIKNTPKNKEAVESLKSFLTEQDRRERLEEAGLIVSELDTTPTEAATQYRETKHSADEEDK